MKCIFMHVVVTWLLKRGGQRRPTLMETEVTGNLRMSPLPLMGPWGKAMGFPCAGAMWPMHGTIHVSCMALHGSIHVSRTWVFTCSHLVIVH